MSRVYNVVCNDTCYSLDADYEISELFLKEEDAIQYIEDIFVGIHPNKHGYFKYMDYRIQYLVYEESLKRFIVENERFFRHLDDFREDFPARKNWIRV